jgi:hypothetical protein
MKTKYSLLTKVEKSQLHATDGFFPGKERVVPRRTRGGLQSISERGDTEKR